MKRNLVAPRSLFFSLLSIWAAVLLWQPLQAQGPDEITWQTFAEAGFGYQIDYPSGWHVSLVVDNTTRAEAYGEAVALRSIGFFGPDSQIVFVDVWLNRSGFSLNDWMAVYPAPGLASQSTIKSTETTLVAGKFAIREIDLPADGATRAPKHYRTKFVHQDLIISLEYAALAPDLHLYEQILARFRLQPPTMARLTPSSLDDTLPPAEFGVQTATCCGVTDPEYNPFPCNTTGDDQCPFPPCGNCTWWVRYRRTGGNEANLIHCTNDALTWVACANQYYPHLVSSAPDDEAVVVYHGLNHLSFVESTIDALAYQASDLSWSASCPAHYFSSSANSNKSFILHPFNYVPNEPPNAPELDTPADETWLASREVTLTWVDGGDPDDGPEPNRQFLTHVENDDWSKHSGWLYQTTWQVDVPEDGTYEWRSKAHDGMFESGWSARWGFSVDTVSPLVSFTPGHPSTERWYNSEQTFSWLIADPEPGSGVDYFKWAWNDDTPENKVEASAGTAQLSVAGQGVHQLYVQAWDKVGHQSATTQLGWIGYDTVPPHIIPDAANPQTGTWHNQPIALAWTAVDAMPGIGVDHVQWVWNELAFFTHNFALNQQIGTQGATTLIPIQGQHTLYLQARDKLGNWSNIESLGWFGYDSVIPEPPLIAPGCAALNNQWQNQCHTPQFTWQSTDLQGSGVAQYRYTWSTDAETTIVGDWSTENSYSPPPIVDPIGSRKAYLHVQAQDMAGNHSSPATFGLWYDGSLPTASFAINETIRRQAVVQLRLNATDMGSGVSEFRIADNSKTWSNWKPYHPFLEWPLSITNNPTHIIYLQVRDKAGNLSPIISKTLVLAVDSSPQEISPVPLSPTDLLAQQDEIFRITLNDDAWYTQAPTITVTVDAPNVVDMRLSHSATFVDQDWRPYQEDLSWELLGSGSNIQPIRLYIWFRDETGSIYGPYFDDIIFDAVGPQAVLKQIDKNESDVTLLFSLWDEQSGVAEMRLSSDLQMTNVSWASLINPATYAHHNTVVYVQFRDRAGNLSPIYGTDGSNSSLTEEVYLPILSH